MTFNSAFFVFSILLNASGAFASEFTGDPRDVDPTDNFGPCQLHMKGLIEPGDFQKFKRMLPKDWEPGMLGPTMCLDSPGGDFIEGLKIAEFVAEGISTRIEAGATCGSACGWIFLAGTHYAPGASGSSYSMDARGTLWFHGPFLDISSIPSVASNNYGPREAVVAYNQAVAEIGRGLLTLSEKNSGLNRGQPMFPPSLVAEALVKVYKDKLPVDTTGAAMRWSIPVTGYFGIVPRSRADIVRACVLGSLEAGQTWGDDFAEKTDIEDYLAFYDAKSRTLVAQIVVQGLAHIACELEFVFDKTFTKLENGIQGTANIYEHSLAKAWIKWRYPERKIGLNDLAVLSPKMPLRNLSATAGARVDPSKLATLRASAWCTSQASKAVDESAICGNMRLSFYDALLGQYFGEAVQKSDAQAREKLRTEQREWLSKRRRCEDEVKCLENAYLDRISDVKGLLQ
jgi:uncharacterized protein YecT (DUF1311 family)